MLPRSALPSGEVLPPSERSDSSEVLPDSVVLGFPALLVPLKPLTPTPWELVTAAILTPDYLAQIVDLVCDCSTLLEAIVDHLFQALVTTYQTKVEQVLQTQGITAIDRSRPHWKQISSPQNGHPTLKLVINEEKVRSHLRTSLAAYLPQEHFWDELAPKIGMNLVMGAIDQLHVSPDDARLHPIPLIQAIQTYLHPENSWMQERLKITSQFYSPEITQKILDRLDLPNCSLPDLEQRLGFKQKPRSPLQTRFDLDAIAPLPTAIAIASSIRAQLRPDLWKREPAGHAIFQYRSRTNPNNYIEHSIIHPETGEVLPWDAAYAILQSFGLETVKLQLIFAARTMSESEPWNSSFTVRATDLIPLLGWERNHSSNLAQKRNMVATMANALSCLLVKSVWVEGRGQKFVDVSTPIARMWDVLIDAHGPMNWLTGEIEKPDEIYITIRPGLWTKYFLNRAGNKAGEALYQFGYLAKDILKIDSYHHDLALRLAIQLTLDARIRARNQRPYDYQVSQLLSDVLPQDDLDRAFEDKHKARDLKNRWNKALELLIQLGWQVEYDPDSYPDWLRPNSTEPKPSNWRKIRLIDRLLHAQLTIQPPHPIPRLLTTLREPRKPKSTPARITIALTPDRLRHARETQGWSRKELGGFLGISADYIGKLERGDRAITSELDRVLRRFLNV